MLDSAEDTSQADGEGPDGSDKPPHSKAHQSIASTTIHANSTTPTPPAPNGRTVSTVSASSRRSSHGEHNLNGVPLPPPESMAHIKEPGFTLQTLGELIRHNHNVPAPGIVATAPSNQSRASSVGPLSSDSDSSSPSAPSTRPPSRAPSIHQDAQPPANDRRSSPVKAAAAAAHALKNGTDPVAAAKQAHKPIEQQKDRGPSASAKNTPASSRRPSVSGSEHNGGQKFNLKDLLASGPKLARRSSARSTASSKKSDSDGQPKSTAGDSTVSLLKKYGVCDRVAIGKGATSVVRIAHKWDRSEEKLYAVKEFRKRRKNETEKEYVKKLTAEFCISSTLHHPNIVETVDLVQDEAQHWCEVMEFCPGGDLYAAIKKGGMAPSEVECCFKQILNGVAYLHSQGVAHRDIKPENLFFDLRGQLKIGDYGASTVYRLPWETTVHMSTGLCGSEPYIAPEQFTGKPYDARLVDIWACGIVYYCLHFQELPWRIAQPSDSLYASYVTACHSSSPQQAACPPTINNLSPRSCRPLLRKMLEPDPKSRWLIEEITQHAWVKGIEVCIDMDKPTHMHQHAKTTVHSMTQAT